MHEFEAYVGQPLEVLTEALHRSGKIIRVTMKDGQPMIVTRDYNTNRLNVTVKGNIVDTIVGFG